jgi:hypothetical protein
MDGLMDIHKNYALIKLDVHCTIPIKQALPTLLIFA